MKRIRNYLILLFLIPISLYGQLMNEIVSTNLLNYSFVPFQTSEFLLSKKVRQMKYYYCKPELFNQYIQGVETTFDEKEIVYVVDFDNFGKAIQITSYLLGQNVYKYTYDTKNHLVAIENYRDGNTNWQNREVFSYNEKGMLVVRKSIWKDYFTFKLDQVSYFNYTYLTKLTKVTHKVTLERGQVTKGVIDQYYTYWHNGIGLDSVLEYKELSNGKWETNSSQFSWEKDSLSRVVRMRRTNELDNEINEWNYNSNGQLELYKVSGYFYGMKQNHGYKFFYNKEDVLIGIQRLDGGMILAIQYK